MRMFARNVVMLWLAMLAMLAMVTVTAMPAFAQEDQVDITFNLTIDGEVPEGQSVSLDFLPQNESGGFEDIFAVFCSPDYPSLPTCEDGGIYTASFISIGGGEPSTGPFPTTAGRPLSYEYTVGSADGSVSKTLESETITPTEDTTVNVTYSPESGETTAPDPGDGETPPSSEVGEPGPNDQYDNDDPTSNDAPDGQYDNDNPSAPDGQNVAPGQTSPAADSSGGQGQSVAILPDTGGLSLAVGLLGALMIGGGLVVRRLLG